MLSRLLRLTVIAGGLLIMSASAQATVPGPSPGLLLKQTNGWQLPYNPVAIAQSVEGTAVYILTEDHQVLIYDQNGNLKGNFPVDSGVVAIDTDVRGEHIFLIDREKKTLRKIAVDFHTAIDITGSPFKGRPDAPVTMVVISDFE